MKILHSLIIFPFFLYGQNSYKNGYYDGYKNGYCYNQPTGCYAPTPFYPNISNKTSYTDGYNDGFNKGQSDSNSTSKTSTQENVKNENQNYDKYYYNKNLEVTNYNLYHSIKSTLESHQLNLKNTISFMIEKCGNTNELSSLLNPYIFNYDKAISIFNTLNKENVDVNKANEIWDIIEKTYNELNYSAKLGAINKYYRLNCK